MIKARIVLVLGAGASVSYGLPTGYELNDIIRAEHIVDERDLPVLRADPHEFRKFRETLDQAGRTSVDAFLEGQPEFVDIGKLAIALALLPRERMHALFGDWAQRRLGHMGDTSKEKGGHWYELMFNMLMAGRKFEDIDVANLSVVT